VLWVVPASDHVDVQGAAGVRGGALPLIDLRRAGRVRRPDDAAQAPEGLTTSVPVRMRQHEFPAVGHLRLTQSGSNCSRPPRSSRLDRTSPKVRCRLADRRRRAQSIPSSSLDAKMLRALAAKPLSLPSSTFLSGVNYPALERRLGAMRLAGRSPRPLPEKRQHSDTRDSWLRQRLPAVAAANWERCRAPSNREPLGRLDVEAIFLLAIPPSTCPRTAEGPAGLPSTSRTAPAGPRRRRVLSSGRPTACASDLRAEVDPALPPAPAPPGSTPSAAATRAESELGRRPRTSHSTDQQPAPHPARPRRPRPVA